MVIHTSQAINSAAFHHAYPTNHITCSYFILQGLDNLFSDVTITLTIVLPKATPHMVKQRPKLPHFLLLIALVFNSVSFVSFPAKFPDYAIPSKHLPALLTDSITPICQIQGKSFSANFLGQSVYIQGIVTFDLDTKKGLFTLQDETCDSDPHTSNAIWVYLAAKADVVHAGDFVEVHGTVKEYFGRTEIETTYDNIWILSQKNLLPVPRELTPPQNNGDSNYYFENHEAMLVSIASANVIGPTDSYADTWVVPASLGLTRLFQDDQNGTGGVLAIDDAGYYKLDPPLKVGDQVKEIVGVLDESYEAYRIYLLNAPQISEIPAPPIPQASTLPDSDSFRLATFNLANLFDTVDDPFVNDQILSNPEYQRRLHKRALAIHDVLGEAELIAVQEAENIQVLSDLISQPQISPDYGVVWENSSDLRGMDVALLYRTDRVTIRAFDQKQGCTSLKDGLGPDGNQNVTYPENETTCDTNGDDINDGNRLFSREPLVVFLEVLSTGAPTENVPIILIVCHFKSKVEDTPTYLYTLARRTEEAEFIAQLVQSYQAQYPEYTVIVAGDLNDYPTSPPLQKLKASGLTDLTLLTEYSNRYSYVYHGISQVTDYILYLPAKAWIAKSIEPLHLNADYPRDWATNLAKADSPIGSSDHDLWQAIFHPTRSYYLPLILNKSR